MGTRISRSSKSGGEAKGKDRPRRRIKAPEPFTLSLDVGGPFVKGQDQIQYHDPRYFMVAVVTIPMAGDRPMVEGLRRLAGDEEPMAEIPRMTFKGNP